MVKVGYIWSGFSKSKVIISWYVYATCHKTQNANKKPHKTHKLTQVKTQQHMVTQVVNKLGCVCISCTRPDTNYQLVDRYLPTTGHTHCTLLLEDPTLTSPLEWAEQWSTVDVCYNPQSFAVCFYPPTQCVICIVHKQDMWSLLYSLVVIYNCWTLLW